MVNDMNSINVNIKLNPSISSLNNSVISNIKNISDVKTNPKKNDESVVVEISEEGKKRQKAAIQSESLGETDNITNSNIINNYHPKMGLYDFNQSEAFRLDEPDNYENFRYSWSKFKESLKYEENGLTKYKDWKQFSDLSPESQEFLSNAVKIHVDWMNRRCLSNGNIQNPVYDLTNNISKIESQLSDSTNQTIIDFYSKKNESLTTIFDRGVYYPKFSIFLSTDMLATLKSSKEQIDKTFFKKIEGVSNNLKVLESKCSNKDRTLLFGAKLYDNGNTTYHASYYDSVVKKRQEFTSDNIDSLYQILVKNMITD